MNRIAILLVIVAACAGDGDDNPDCADGKCDAACLDPGYADGVCDVALDCDAPDLDCFRTFADDDEAAAWLAELEPRVATLEGRPARPVVPPSDPRHAAVRALLDRGWDAMRSNRPVGLLAEHRPALVLVDDPTVNAFVFPEDVDQKRASFAVMVNTGTIAIPTTADANLGLMMHELQHAVGLHVVAGVAERLATYYLAPAGDEPIGREQDDDAEVRTAATLWRARAGEVGPFVNAELRGLPTGGDLQAVLRTVVQMGTQANPAGCEHARGLLTELASDIAARIDLVGGAPALDDSFGPRVTAALAALRDECVPDAPSFVEVVAAIAGVSPDQIDAQLTAEDRALVADVHVVDAIAALAQDRRAKMRALEAELAPWTAVRYFSEEEDADDTSVPVLRAAGLDPAGLGTFLVDVLLPPAAGTACKDVLAAGQIPPYGVDLTDTHHATCWRVFHIDQLPAGAAKPRARRTLHPVADVPRLPIPRPRRIGMH